jgi:hypothetical protein
VRCDDFVKPKKALGFETVSNFSHHYLLRGWCLSTTRSPVGRIGENRSEFGCERCFNTDAVGRASSAGNPNMLGLQAASSDYPIYRVDLVPLYFISASRRECMALTANRWGGNVPRQEQQGGRYSGRLHCRHLLSYCGIGSCRTHRDRVEFRAALNHRFGSHLDQRAPMQSVSARRRQGRKRSPRRMLNVKLFQLCYLQWRRSRPSSFWDTSPKFL